MGRCQSIPMVSCRKNTWCRVPFSLYLWDSSRQMFCRMKLRIFDATPKRTLGLSTNFSRQTRNFMCPALHFFVVCQQIDICRKHFTHRLPRKYFFLDLRPRKRHVGWKNNFKQFLPWCCYTNFCSFARKS